jgi:hypothetical protein
MKQNILLNMTIGMHLICAVGCASIVSKSSYDVAVASNIKGANVTVIDKNGQEVAKVLTPSTVCLSAKSGYFSRAEYTFRFQREGYKSCDEKMRASIDPWYWGNILLGGCGLVGFFISDPMSGAMWKLDDSVSGFQQMDGSFSGEIGTERAPVGATGHPRDDRDKKLRDLEELNAQGVLSPEEYQRRRAELTGGTLNK